MERRYTRCLTLALALAHAVAAFGLSAEDKCEADKNKIAGKYAFCRQKAEAKAIKKSLPPDYSKCDAKLLDKWAKAEARAVKKGTTCIDSISGAEIQSFTTAHADSVAAALDGGSLPVCTLPVTGQTVVYGAGSDGDLQQGATLAFADNGDGTVTDHNTGLTWEKKDDAGGIHDVDNTYAWCGASCGATHEMDGAMVTTFLDTLNDVGGGGASCFAGHCDWRIPNQRELQSLVHYQALPATDPALHQGTCSGCLDITDPACSCTASAEYWSSTTVLFIPNAAWKVNFTSGTTAGSTKPTALRVRAVRGP